MLDLGCGGGALLERLIREDYELILGADVSVRALEQAARRLKLDEMHDAQRQRISLIQSPLPAGQFRHLDHRFEWTRDEFATWAQGVGSRNGYGVRHLPVGPEDPEVGAPTQMAVFSR